MRHHTHLGGKTYYMLLTGIDSHVPAGVSQLVETGLYQGVNTSVDRILVHQLCYLNSASLDP